MIIDDLPSSLNLALESLHRQDVTSPQLPAPTLLSMAQAVLAASPPESQARQDLIEIGLGASFFQLFESIVLWADKTNAQWDAYRHVGKHESLLSLEVQGIELRGELVAACRFYLRRDPSTQDALKAILYGEGIADLILDLNSLATLIRSNKRAFSRAGKFDPDAHVKRTKSLIGQLRESRWQSEWNVELDQVRDRRDRLFTLLHKKLIEICVAGQYCFFNDDQLKAPFVQNEPPTFFMD